MPQLIPDTMVESLLGGQILWWIKHKYPATGEPVVIQDIQVEWGEEHDTGLRTCQVTARVQGPGETEFAKAAIKAVEPFSFKAFKKTFMAGSQT